MVRHTHGVQLMHELGMKVLNPRCNTLESVSHLNENTNKIHSPVVRAGIKSKYFRCMESCTEDITTSDK